MKAKIGSALAPATQKYATQDPYPRLPFSVDEDAPDHPMTWVIWAIVVVLLATGIVVL